MTISFNDVNCFCCESSRFITFVVVVVRKHNCNTFLSLKHSSLANRNVYQVVKTLDEQKCKFTTISSLFIEDVVAKRENLVASIESILLDDFETIGKKTRDILWRKVYYDPICISKKLWKQNLLGLKEDETFQLINFIKIAIKHYKTLILKFEDLFSLDIRYIIDFAIIANGADAFEKKTNKEIYTVNEMTHAMESIHAFLVCLGDLHRYCIEFNFAEKDVSINTSKELASKYYIEAFKLNPKIGMPHNQLGTLRAGENHEIDSIFHYLYSLCSPVPFDLSEANVNRVFQQNVEALEKMEQIGDNVNVKDFIMQMILVIDIFFYDKEIGEFNTICRSVLQSFKEYLTKNRRSHQVDLTFQLTSIFMLCLLKLKLKNSPKVHSLVAFLVAFCDEIVGVAIKKADDFIADHKDENLKFGDVYNRKFVDFDKKIKNARETVRGVAKDKPIKTNKSSESERNGSVNSSQKNGHGSNHLSVESKQASDEASGKSDPAPITIAKKPLPAQQLTAHNRRRRKRCKVSGSSNSSDESETESLHSDSEDNVSMNSDFESYDEQDDDFSDRYSSDADGPKEESDNEDLVIENEEIVYANGFEKATNGEHQNGDHQNNFYAFQEEVHQNGLETSSNDDFIIEHEQFVYPEGDDDDDKSLKLKYKKKYSKVDPNLIIRFNEKYAGWMKSLKILFDWLRLSSDVLVDCYRSNPEFVNKIMKLINILNIDIFTRKIYFDRSLLTVKNVRENLRSLFDIRNQIATDEDVVFKKFVLFEELQRELSWEHNYKLHITPEEDAILRNFKIIDFGFHLCKMKKFGYNFCARSRFFIEKVVRRRNRGQRKVSDDRNSVKKGPRRRDRRRNRDRKRATSDCERFERLTIKKHDDEQEVEEYPSIEQSHQRNFRKGYLKSKTTEKMEKDNEAQNMKEDNAKQVDKKNELMGKLWLKSEIQTLESRKQCSSVALTPYVMLDSNCLTDYLYIVKNLVKSKKFVVLIPKAGKNLN